MRVRAIEAEEMEIEAEEMEIEATPQRSDNG